MSSTEDTSAIDEKKTEDSGNNQDFKGFATNYVSSIIVTIGIFIFIVGGLGLYTTKVAQANILPDNIEQAPYTIFDRIVKNIPININVMRPTFWSENKDTFSQKVEFNSQEYLDSFSNSFLCSLKKKADPKDGTNVALYFSRVYDNLVAKNLLAINTIFFYLSYFPESIIMFLYGLFGIFVWIGLYLFNMCISIFYHFVNIPELFRETNDGKDKWESNDNISFFRFVKILMFCFVWIPVGLFSTFFMPIFFTIYGLIAPLFATYNIKGTNKSYGAYDFIKDTFAYKKFFFFILATISLLYNGTTYLGNNSIIGILIAVMFAYFMGLYTNEMPQNGVDGFTAKISTIVKQAFIVSINVDNLVNICPTIDIEDNNKINNLISTGNFRKLTSKETGGSSITRSIPVTITEPTITEPTITEPTITEPININTTPININTTPININTTPINTTIKYPEQNGGKKMTKTKKYNIRLV